MQITFDPLNGREARAVALLLETNLEIEVPAGVPLSQHVPNLPTLTLSEAPTEERSAASVFAGAAPLSDALLGAGATPLPNVPVALPGSSPLPAAGLPGLALPGLPAGVQPANAPAGSPAGGVELDADGIPWHHEIHASTKSKTAKGVWTKLRGLNDEAKYNRIVAELKALHALPAGSPPPAAAVQPTVTQVHAISAGDGRPMGTAFPTPAGALPAGLPPLQPLQAASLAPQDFDALLPRITAGQAAGILPDRVLEEACTARQLPGIVALVSRPDYVPFIWADIQARYPALV